MGFLNFAFAFALSLILLDGARSTARAPHAGARPRHRRPLGRDLVRAPVPARGRGRAGRAARRHPRHLARAHHGRRRAAVAARARGAAVARGRAAAPGQGRARHGRPPPRSPISTRGRSSRTSGPTSPARSRGWGSMTIVPALLLPGFAWKQRRAARPFFSTPAMAVLAAAYVGLPVMLSNWWYLNCRLVPFLWAGLLLRLPEQRCRGRSRSCSRSARCRSRPSTGVDYVRLDRDRAEFTAGIDAVPARRHAAAVDVQAQQDQRFHRQPDPRLGLLHGREGHVGAAGVRGRALLPDHLPGLSAARADPAGARPVRRDVPAPRRRCASCSARSRSTPACTAAWRELWAGFWREAEPRFSHLLTWAMPPEARPHDPAALPSRLRRGRARDLRPIASGI